MARRATAASVPGSPPKRMTRARAAQNTGISDAPAIAVQNEAAAADKKAAPARGRPRTKTADTTTTAKPASRRKASNATTYADGVEPKKQRVKRGRKKTNEVAQDSSALDGDSSDDEMDIVTVKPKLKMASSTCKTGSVSRVAAGTDRKAAPILTKQSQEESGNFGDSDDDDDELAQPGPPKRLQGRPKTTSTTRKSKAVATGTSQKAPVGRPKKAIAVTTDDDTKGTSKTIHISAASLTAASATSRARTTVATVPRKKVTFLDMITDSDKENQPITSSTATDPKQKIKIGIKSKPVRKATAPPGERDSAGIATEERKKEPLSPKKATQVARSGSSASSADDAEDDDLSSPRPRIPRHNGSPVKRDPHRPFNSPVKKIDFVSPTKPSSQGPSPPRGAQSIENTFLCHIKPSAVPAKHKSPTKLFDQAIKEELNTDSAFADYPLGCGMGLFGVRGSSGGLGGNSYHPVLEDASDVSPAGSPAQGLNDPFVISEILSTPSGYVSGYDICHQDASVSSTRDCIPPAAPSPPIFMNSRAPLVYRDDIVEESDDELMKDASPLKLNNDLSRRNTLLGAAAEYDMSDIDRSEEKLGFTPLAERLSQWGAISPVKRRSSRLQNRGIFSPLKPSELVDHGSHVSEKDNGLEHVPQPLALRLSIASGIPCSTLFEDGMSVHHRESVDGAVVATELGNDMVREKCDKTTNNMIGDDAMDLAPEILENSDGDNEAFGDENAAPSDSTVPIDPRLFDEDVSRSKDLVEKANPIVLPMSVTPVRSRVYPRTIHTVSKVPLRPDGDGSVLKVPRKRVRSLSSSPIKNSSRQLGKTKLVPALSPQKAMLSLKQSHDDIAGCEAESEQPNEAPDKYNASKSIRSSEKSAAKSPSKSNPVNDKVLQGAVVFADVHTAEGADASGIFVELLTQMGARCVKSWSWNPRASLSPVDSLDPKEGKVGITHVVFKDGGVRTLEKVREANGLVKCVGVGWVLDCERKGKWLDEINYGVDLRLIPRGGQKRRKSMEPRALSNFNGSIIKLDSSTSSNGGRCSVSDRETFQELMRLSPTPPSSRRESMEWDREFIASESEQKQHPAFQSTPTNPSRSVAMSQSSAVVTPTTPDFSYAFDFDGASAPSPITPYHPSQGTQLTQQTCPPKQLRQGLFGNHSDSPMSEGLRIRLEAARRRSLVWKPKVGSPLGRPGMKL
ncbi:predicted protein [Histoplasma mississippiense (nom. inval.)]|uniref:predicted protein n=1 Tax=Ajellomyces capsulatus (strain NAm1 / WU24) TaxID=2059318 RepID=UPI000157CD94|nr:predicted protein [Histoplasma mississippiense (nom. inval.)]EDN10392.1 predicted protein [Histoplasma mississippiense (nom. inval.)]